MPPEELASLSDMQLEIMKIIWDQKEATVASVWKTMKETRKIARNTVLTQMTRLDEKGWLAHRSEGNTFIYIAKVPRKKTMSRILGEIAEKAFGGSMDGLVMAFLDGKKISKEEADRIRTIIDKAERRK